MHVFTNGSTPYCSMAALPWMRSSFSTSTSTGKPCVSQPALRGTLVAAHRLVAGEEVLDDAREDVAVVRQPVRGRRSLVEYERWRIAAAPSSDFSKMRFSFQSARISRLVLGEVEGGVDLREARFGRHRRVVYHSGAVRCRVRAPGKRRGARRESCGCVPSANRAQASRMLDSLRTSLPRTDHPFEPDARARGARNPRLHLEQLVVEARRHAVPETSLHDGQAEPRSLLERGVVETVCAPEFHPRGLEVPKVRTRDVTTCARSVSAYATRTR